MDGLREGVEREGGLTGTYELEAVQAHHTQEAELGDLHVNPVVAT